jgi:ferredoxin, 2Fe-2S
MPLIKVLPHDEICPDGAMITAETGTPVIDVLLQNGIHIEHACEKQCACTTCHVYIREGLDSLNEAEELEEDMLDKAWGLDMDSRLSCQTLVGEKDLVVEIPKYTINMVSEN